ncbi:unnamed protein product [Sphacelaria rigidula]
MAATSTPWALGATHNTMTADISAPTPVANPSSESPIKPKSFNMMEGGANKESGSGNNKDAAVPSSPVVPTSPLPEPSSSPEIPSSPVENNPVCDGSSVMANGGRDGEDEEGVATETKTPGGVGAASEPEAGSADAVGDAAKGDISVVANGAAASPEICEKEGQGEAAGEVEDSAGEGREKTAGGVAAERLMAAPSTRAVSTLVEDGAVGDESVTENVHGDGAVGNESVTENVDGEGESAEAVEAAAAAAAAIAAAVTTAAKHGPVLSTVSAGASAAGNGHNSPHGSPRQETDEHAARASDAATAALMAALASATRDPPPQRRPPATARQSPSLSKTSPTAAGTTPSCLKSENHSELGSCAAATTERENRHGGSRSRDLVMFFSKLPRPLEEGAAGGNGEEELESLVYRAMLSAGYRWPQPVPASGGESAAMESEDDADALADLPLPLTLSESSGPCMVGYFGADGSADSHRCMGTWAMSKKDLSEAEKVESRASPFEFKALPRRDGDPMQFPHSGAYQGHFLVRQTPRPVLKVSEDKLEINFARNREGFWNVEGEGHNRYGSFSIAGRLDGDRRLEVYRSYKPAPKSARGGHRRANSISTQDTGAGTGSYSAPPAHSHSLYGRSPKRGKHPRTDLNPPAASLPSASPPGAPGGLNGIAAGGWHADAAGRGGGDSSHDAPAPAGSRRVSRTPSYLISDIGSEGTAHLSQGLRKCLTVLKSVMSVPRKSEWFLAPVDHVALQLLDYTRIIKRPMDLGTVRKNLESGQYENSSEFAADVRLVFSNARLYNSDPTCDVHVAARELNELFETKFHALGSSLDNPPSKRKKSPTSGGGAGGGGAESRRGGGPGVSAGWDTFSDPNSYFSELEQDHDDSEPQPPKEKKRKSWAAGGEGSATGASASKKARPASESAPQISIPEMKSIAPLTSPYISFPGPNLSPFPRACTEKNASPDVSLIPTQGGAAKRQGSAKSTGSSRKKKEGGGAKKAAGGGAKSKGGGGANSGAGGAKPKTPKATKAPKAPKAPKTPKPKTPKAGRGGAEAAAAAQVPLTFDEKKALSVAINKLDQDNLTRVVEIIQNRMPLGSSDEEIELDIDAMDNLTLRDLQRFIMEVSGGPNGAGGVGVGGDGSESDSESEAW